MNSSQLLTSASIGISACSCCRLLYQIARMWQDFAPTISSSNESPTYHISEGAVPKRVAAEVKITEWGFLIP